MDALDTYLARQSEVGTRDSEGSFTISAERALDKLSAHQLPRTSAWILKMVQAGVVSGASGMWVNHGMRSCKIRFADGRFGSLEQIREAWVEHLPIKERVHQHLSVALRTVAFARRRPVLVIHRCPDQGLRSLFWNGVGLSRIGPAEESLGDKFTPGEFAFFISRSPLGRDESSKRIHGVDVTAAETRELTSHAVCSPMPLWADSRPINHFGLEDVSMVRKSLAFSAQLAGHQSPTLQLPPHLVKSCGFEQAGLAWTLYHSSRAENSRISWVKDGVVCEEENIHTHPDFYQVRLFAPADDLETDLTALQLRFPSRDLKSRRTAAAVLSFCRELNPSSPIALEIGESEQKSKGRWGTASLLILGGVFFAPVTSGYSLLASAGAAVSLAIKNACSKSGAPPALVGFVEQLQRRYHGHG